MIHEHSAGSIIYRQKAGKIEFLIVQSVLHHTWGFAKGHLEAGETEKLAAKREVFEEVGLKPKFDFNFRQETEYVTEENTLKKVAFFLSRALLDQKVTNQKAEILNSKWVTLQQSKKYIDNSRKLYDILQKANSYIEERAQSQK